MKSDKSDADGKRKSRRLVKPPASEPASETQTDSRTDQQQGRRTSGATAGEPPVGSSEEQTTHSDSANTSINPVASGPPAGESPEQGERRSSLANLTPREVEILELLSEKDVLVKEIADHLNISPSAVNEYLRRMYHKIGVRNARAAVRWYWQHFHGQK